MSQFFDLLNDNEFVFLDGGMGTMIQAAGIDAGHVPELLNLTEPETIMNIHRQYAESGSDIIYANTFGANRYKLNGTGHSVEEVISAGIANAKKAVGEKVLVALDLGPIGQLLEPSGILTFEEAYDCYKEQVLAGKDADIIVLETMTDLYEVKAALLAAKENSDKPVLVTMSFEENQRTFTGVSPECMIATVEGLGADALGVNCSLGPVELMPVVEKICLFSKIPVIAKPNAGLPDPITNLFNVGAEEFAESASRLRESAPLSTMWKYLSPELSASESILPAKNASRKLLSPTIWTISSVRLLNRYTPELIFWTLMSVCLI